jgi:hypothetical protein
MERFWVDQRRITARGYEGIPGREKPYNRHGYMNTWQKYVRNHTKCVDLSKLGMSG